MSGASFAETLRESLRLEILRTLASRQCPESTLAEHLLGDQARQAGLSVSLDQVRTACQWLNDQGLVVRQPVSSGVAIVTLTDAGLDCAHGRALVPGVARPRPGQVIV